MLNFVSRKVFKVYIIIEAFFIKLITTLYKIFLFTLSAVLFLTLNKVAIVLVNKRHGNRMLTTSLLPFERKERCHIL